MIRSRVTLLGVLLFAAGCGEGDREPLPPVDCSVLDRYEFLNISDFTAGSYFYQYGDPTPGASPGAQPVGDVPVSDLEPPGRCGDTRFVKFAMSGHNFWGAGFGDWSHNDPGSRANGTDYAGISFWARSPRNFEKWFLFGVDDSRTIMDPPDPPDAGLAPPATAADQDLDGDGFIGPGDIGRGTKCRLPPPSEIGTADCYNGGVDAPPSGGARVPLENECGNQFHTWITTTETWQLFLIPWDELVQWPCPNRLQGGIDRADIAKFEIKFKQGTRYEIWLDNIAFYRRR
jgi:hypothetical protein